MTKRATAQHVDAVCGDAAKFAYVIAAVIVLALIGGTVAAFNNIGSPVKTHFDPVMP